jgi:hypothetical protein
MSMRTSRGKRAHVMHEVGGGKSPQMHGTKETNPTPRLSRPTTALGDGKRQPIMNSDEYEVSRIPATTLGHGPFSWAHMTISHAYV